MLKWIFLSVVCNLEVLQDNIHVVGIQTNSEWVS
jgi:hypothetical protein